MIKYSIILTTLNEEKNVAIVLNQLAKFNRKDFEVILIDGGSTDATLDLVKQQRYSFPLTTRVEKSDLNSARNTGLDLAKGEVVCILTANNYLPENYLDRLDRYYNEGYDVVLCLYEMPTNPDNWQGAWQYAQRRLLYDGKENTAEFLWTEGFSCRTVLAKRVSFPFVNRNASGAEGWFAKQLIKLGAKVACATDIDVRLITPSQVSDFIHQRKSRTRGTVFMEYYVYKRSKLSVVLRAFGRVLLNLVMFFLLVPSLLDAFKLVKKSRERSLKWLPWFFAAGQLDLFARAVGKLEAVLTVLFG